MKGMWFMWGWVFWACFQGFFIPNYLTEFSAFERALLALLADATVAMAFGICAVVNALRAAR